MITKNTIEITGESLIPSFSVYVLEVVKGKEKWYYVGMTGDNHYPSARSPFHRLAGHFDLQPRSTQNQLRGYIASKVFKLGDERELTAAHLQQILIRMHHFPLEGFTPWQFGMDVATLNAHHEEYAAYKERQRKVALIEDRVIELAKGKLGDRVLNTKGRIGHLDAEDETIAVAIFEEVFHG